MKGQTRFAWVRHPSLAFKSEVRTRLGMAPNHFSFRAGVLRTHLLTALYAHVVAENLQTAAQIYARFDDTNAKRSQGIETEGLLKEIRHIAQIPLSQIPSSIEANDWAIYQSQRKARYWEVLNHLERLALIREHNGALSLSIPETDIQLAAKGINPTKLVTQCLVNVERVPVDHPRAYVPLVRTDGTPLWHLATVVDDIDLGVNLVVRGTDKINAVAIQERLRWILTEGCQRVSYIFVPRLIESDNEKSRVAWLLKSGIRASSLRWYLAEPFCHSPEKRLPENFTELASLVRRNELLLRDSLFDPVKLAALDRKMPKHLSIECLRQDLIDCVGSKNQQVIDFIAQEWHRPLPDQIRLYNGMTSLDVDFDQAPENADVAIAWMTSYLAGKKISPTPYCVRWLLTGCADGPAPDELLQFFPDNLLNQRLNYARKVLS